ncbi:MAG: hypothetical protein AAGF24_01335 [Cyanobacteria bacterium P01_H01_bin.121]
MPYEEVRAISRQSFKAFAATLATWYSQHQGTEATSSLTLSEFLMRRSQELCSGVFRMSRQALEKHLGMENFGNNRSYRDFLQAPALQHLTQAEALVVQLIESGISPKAAIASLPEQLPELPSELLEPRLTQLSFA